MVALAIFHVGQQRPDTSGCDASIPRFPAPGDPPDYVSVVACGELVFEGSREAAERFLRHAVEGPPTAVYTAAAAGLAVLGAALIALGNVGAPARRRMSPDGRVRLVAAGGAVGLAVGVVTSAVVHPVMYDRGLLMYTDQLLDLVFLVPAYMILGAVFGATYRPAAR